MLPYEVAAVKLKEFLELHNAYARNAPIYPQNPPPALPPSSLKPFTDPFGGKFSPPPSPTPPLPLRLPKLPKFPIPKLPAGLGAIGSKLGLIGTVVALIQELPKLPKAVYGLILAQQALAENLAFLTLSAIGAIPPATKVLHGFATLRAGRQYRLRFGIYGRKAITWSWSGYLEPPMLHSAERTLFLDSNSVLEVRLSVRERSYTFGNCAGGITARWYYRIWQGDRWGNWEDPYGYSLDTVVTCRDPLTREPIPHPWRAVEATLIDLTTGENVDLNTATLPAAQQPTPTKRPTPVAPTRPAAPVYPSNPVNPVNPTVPTPVLPSVRPNAAGVPEPVLETPTVDRPIPWPNTAPTPDQPQPQPIPIAPFDPENPATSPDPSNPAPIPLTPETEGTSRDRPPEPRGTNAPAPSAAPAAPPNYQFQPTDPAAPPLNQDTSSQSICRFFPISLSPVLALLEQILEMLREEQQQGRAPLIKTEQLALPYVSEQEGQRTLQQHFFEVVAGTFPMSVISKFNQTAQWALIKPDEYARKTYELLGGGSLFDANHQATLNPETTIRQEINRIAPDGENVNTVQVLGVAGLITSLVAATSFRQGLHTFPRAIETLEDDLVSPATSIARNTVDVTMVSNRQGMAIMKGLKAAQEFLNKVSQRLHFDRVTNMLTLITTLHNALMLSRNLAESLGFLIDESLKVVGWQPKDEEGRQIPISEIIGNSLRGFVISLIGEEAFNGAARNWHNLNRIITSAANIVWSFQSIGFSILQALEAIGEMNAKVANALRKYGVVFEKAYGWFNPTPNFQNRWFTRLEQAQTLVDNLETIVSEVRNIQETVDQLGQQRSEFLEAWEQGIRDAFPEHEPAKNQAQEAKDTSQSPPIDPVDLIRPEE